MLDKLSSNLPLLGFILVIAVYVIGGFIILYHLIRFGIGNQPKIAAFVFFSGSVILVLFTAVFFFNLQL